MYTTCFICKVPSYLFRFLAKNSELVYIDSAVGSRCLDLIVLGDWLREGVEGV